MKTQNLILPFVYSIHINVSKYATGKIDLVLLSAIYSSFFFQDSLLPDKGYIFKVFRQEKSYLHQDYAVLATKIIVNKSLILHL
jgi:hypothetical protein